MMRNKKKALDRVCVCFVSMLIRYQVEGVPMEAVRVSLFFKQKLMVMMLDMSMACTVSKSSCEKA